MKTLQEEREAIVEELFKNDEIRSKKFENKIKAALLAYEEKVLERIIRELEKYQHESDMNSIGIQHLIKKLTLPIID
jgi:hypothetical protein